jgi:hypothetical protein
MTRTRHAGRTIRAAATGLVALSLTAACGSSSSEHNGAPTATVAGKSVTWSTPAGCVERSCKTGKVYRLVIEDADGTKHTLTVDAAAAKACSPGDVFPDCAQNADAAP